MEYGRGYLVDPALLDMELEGEGPQHGAEGVGVDHGARHPGV